MAQGQRLRAQRKRCASELLRIFWAPPLLALAACIASPPGVAAQALGSGTRTVEGRVIAASNEAQPNSIVYLENDATRVVKTYITPEDGAYRFSQLAADADYEVWAKYGNSKSKTRLISSFDSREQFNFDLKLEPVKGTAK